MAKKSITKATYAKVKKKIVKVQKQKQGQTINISINSNNKRKQTQGGQQQPPPQNRRPVLQQPNIILNMRDKDLISQDPLMFNLARQFENIKNTQAQVLNQLNRQDIKEAQQSYLINQGTNLLSKMNDSDPNNERLSQMEAMIARNRDRIEVPDDDGISFSFFRPKPPIAPPPPPPTKPTQQSGRFAPTKSQIESAINKLKPVGKSKSVGEAPSSLNPLISLEAIQAASANLKPIKPPTQYLFYSPNPTEADIVRELSKADASGAKALEAVSKSKSAAQNILSKKSGTSQSSGDFKSSLSRATNILSRATESVSKASESVNKASELINESKSKYSTQFSPASTQFAPASTQAPSAPSFQSNKVRVVFDPNASTLSSTSKGPEFMSFAASQLNPENEAKKRALADEPTKYKTTKKAAENTQNIGKYFDFPLTKQEEAEFRIEQNFNPKQFERIFNTN
jgi:hypothetical protein